ncbi:MAG: 4-(cytidine 5'-diphospho)-2-C-methyl-D-erythritol kinase [Alphaproteobacteria bacterium]
MITTHCPAKINLCLKILNQRPDGFHNLLSLVSKINLFDVLSVEKSSSFSLKISGPFAKLIDNNNNLFLTILNYFQENYSINNNLKITLEKNIPVGAGLGGGSSNACSFMNILNQIFELNLSNQELQKISLNFGSDIAFFFKETPQIMMSRGEVLHDFNNLKKLHIVLIYPQINLSTKKIFSEYSLTKKPTSSQDNLPTHDQNFLKNFSQQQFFQMANDLENIAIKHAPIIEELKNICLNFQPITCKMSGSGSTVFAIFDNQKQAQLVSTKLQESYNNFFIKYLQNI